METNCDTDEEGKREVLEAVFMGFVVENKRIIDVDVRAPYNWLMRWSGSPVDVISSVTD